VKEGQQRCKTRFFLFTFTGPVTVALGSGRPLVVVWHGRVAGYHSARLLIFSFSSFFFFFFFCTWRLLLLLWPRSVKGSL